jgi:hypothetical protein
MFGISGCNGRRCGVSSQNELQTLASRLIKKDVGVALLGLKILPKDNAPAHILFGEA